MKIAVSGSTGFIGSALTTRLLQLGHEVLPIIRDRVATNHTAIGWLYEDQYIEKEKFQSIEMVIHLAGENIFGWWNKARKKRIRDSRVLGSRLLCDAILQCQARPSILLCASAVGIYGDRGEEKLSEESEAGQGFLSEVCKEWEQATEVLKMSGTRVVNMRFGIVLDSCGGALKTMLPAFRAGLGGMAGDGKQFISWISREDVINAIIHCLNSTAISGPVNMVAPEPVTNEQFVRTLGQVLGRPTIMALPESILIFFLGEMADELCFASQRAFPVRLQKDGFEFSHPSIRTALQSILQ
ncbi:MAG: TIGR01777 family protein [Deltaproteobacteria bacterium]|nr:TIGR01777 family protein [Deltaproteobacteria bacterium]